MISKQFTSPLLTLAIQNLLYYHGNGLKLSDIYQVIARLAEQACTFDLQQIMLLVTPLRSVNYHDTMRLRHLTISAWSMQGT